MDTTQTARRPRSTRAVAALLVGALLLTAGAVLGSPAPAGAGTPPTHSLTWRISTQAFTASSLAPAHATEPPTVKLAEAWSFPTVASSSYDPATKAGTASFPGAIILGNTLQGNYRIRFASPTVEIDPGGTDGRVTMDVSYALTPAAPEDPHVYTTPVRVTVADLTFAPGDIVDSGNTVSFTVTPDYVLRTDLAENPDGFRQFPQPLLDLLDAQLRGHFRETATGQTAKAPAPITVSFPYTPPPPASGLLWRMSQQAFTSSSLSPAHSTEAPALKTTEGFAFPQAVDGTYEPATGSGQVTFPGSYTLGNIVQGNYRIKVADPTLVLEGDDGALVADVSYALWNANTQQHDWAPVTTVTVATFPVAPGDVTLDGDLLSLTVTPDFVLRTDLAENPNGFRQFPPAFVDLLDAQLKGHFRETATGQVAKVPADIFVTDVPVELIDVDTPDEAFVRNLYLATLDRPVDEGALEYWTGRLAGGTSRQAVANAVSGSAEGRRNLVRIRYDVSLGRGPSTTEEDYWGGRVAGGMTGEDLTLNLLGSPEAYAVHGGDGEGLATAAYYLYLDRDPDAGGLEYWAGRLGVDQTSAARKSALRTFGRLSPSTATAVVQATERACGKNELSLTTDQRSALEAAWVQTGRNPVRLAGYAVVLVCPEGVAPL